MLCIEVSSHHKWVSCPPSNIRHKTSECFSLCTGSYIDCNYGNTVGNSLVPLIMALISSSLLAAPFAFHNAIFIGVWSFPMLYRGTSPAVWRSGPDTTLLLLGSGIIPRTVSSGEAPQPRTFYVANIREEENIRNFEDARSSCCNTFVSGNQLIA